jgi:hypothetical protein
MINRIITEEEKNAMLIKLLEQECGYKKAHDLIDATYDAYDPIEYAVKKATNNLEIRTNKESKTKRCR